MNDIKKLRVLKRYTVQQISNWTGVSPSTIHRIEKQENLKRADLLMFIGLYAVMLATEDLKKYPSLAGLLSHIRAE